MVTIEFIVDQYGEVWTLNGNRHRETGPAMIDNDGSKYWYLEGVRVDEEHVKENPINYLL